MVTTRGRTRISWSTSKSTTVSALTPFSHKRQVRKSLCRNGFSYALCRIWADQTFLASQKPNDFNVSYMSTLKAPWTRREKSLCRRHFLARRHNSARGGLRKTIVPQLFLACRTDSPRGETVEVLVPQWFPDIPTRVRIIGLYVAPLRSLQPFVSDDRRGGSWRWVQVHKSAHLGIDAAVRC